jgi:NodT family efflux transporter outer membrane factor (OMF) lipoprotein
MQRAFALVCIALAGCAGAPLSAPEQAAPAQYTPAPVFERTAGISEVHGGAAQQFLFGQDLPAQWWTLFRSPALDALVRQALAGSPSLAQAAARLREVEEDSSARGGAARYPHVDAKLGANRIDVDPQALGVPQLPVAMPFNLYLASVAVSYKFDLFGGTRHELAALQSGVDHQRYQLAAARLALAGNVVTAAIREAALREQIALTEEMVALQQRQLAIVEEMERIGTAARADAALRRQELAQARALLPDLQRQLAQLRHRLAVYTGQPPATAELPQFRLADLQLPAQLPVSLPAELVRQRPDIRAAEALLQQAGERVGVATANLYPQLTLSATAGVLGTHAGDLLSAGSGFYLLGASLAQPVFRGGELQARRRAALAAYERAGAAWREAVLEGWQNVGDVLRALEADAAKLQQRAEAAGQARRVHAITAGREQAGGVSTYALLESERRLQAALLEQAQAVADRYADSAALLQALGGGWWQEPADATPR